MLVSVIYSSKILEAIYIHIKYKIQPYDSKTKTF